MTLTRAFSLTLLASLATIVACGGSDSTPETPGAVGQTTTPPPGGETPPTQDPGGQQATPPPPPPLTAPPSEDKITEEFGVFVSADGVDGAPGTRTQPLKSIQQGIQLAQSTSRFVYVCAGTYHEAITVAQGIPIIGGFECGSSGWKLGTTVNSKVESPTSPAVKADGIELLTRIEGIDFAAPNGTDAAPTSIGLLAKNSKGLWFERVNITAGNGRDGANGTEGTPLTLQVLVEPGNSTGGYKPGLDFQPPVPPQGTTSTNGGSAQCVGSGAPFPTGNGGRGGRNAKIWSKPCAPANSITCAAHPYAWDAPSEPATPGAAGEGSGASKGTDGASASTAGTLTEAGFTSKPGTKGTQGTVGKGGTGSAGEPSIQSYPPANNLNGFSASGAGGGAGGCPGVPGNPGGGGGASIGALISNSTGLTFSTSTIVSGQGGGGGKGTFGALATLGDEGGTGSWVAQGDRGETGGASGVSGSGAGGSSYGIATKGGEATMINGSKATAGAPGAGVPADTKTDAVGVTKTIPASVAGVAKDVETF